MLTIKVTLKEALQKQKNLIKELKSTQFKIIKLGAKEFLTDQEKVELEELLKIQDYNHKNIVLVKLSLRKGISEDLMTFIFKLTELKEQLKCLEKLSTTVGKQEQLIEVQKKIENIEKYIKATNECTIIDLNIEEPDVTPIIPKN